VQSCSQANDTGAAPVVRDLASSTRVSSGSPTITQSTSGGFGGPSFYHFGANIHNVRRGSDACVDFGTKPHTDSNDPAEAIGIEWGNDLTFRNAQADRFRLHPFLRSDLFHYGCNNTFYCQFDLSGHGAPPDVCSGHPECVWMSARMFCAGNKKIPKRGKSAWGFTILVV